MLASVKLLLTSIVDYAGLFPPAKLDLQKAMANYVQYRASPYAWMLGRFVLSVSQLNAFEALLPAFPLKQWSLSAIVSRDLESELERVRSLNDSDRITVTALEFPPLPPSEIESVLSGLSTAIDSFFEIPLSENLELYLRVLQRRGASAKIRTGGTTVNAFPSTTQLYQFIFACAAAQVPFKATAGLHHPLPANHHLTSEPNSPATVMHGFLNVALLAALVHRQKVTPEEALEVLKQPSIDEFQFKEDSIWWRDRYLNLTEIKAARHFFRSFGSCSFQEPVDDLKHLKLL